LGVLPNIYTYDNYRTYLKDAFGAMKAENKKFSFRFFARIAGFSSHNTLWNAIDGRGTLSEESIDKVAKALKLTKEEAQFFKNLVFLNQAKNSEAKASLTREIIRSRSYRRTHPLKDAQLRYYTHWYYVVIREMVNLPNFSEDPEWIAAHTVPPIPPKQAAEAVDELVKLGLLSREAGGKLIQTNTLVGTTDEVTSALVAGFHREFMKRAGDSIDLVPRDKRDISSVTIRASADKIKALKEKIQNFRRELVEEASRHTDADVIYQLNLQLFPVTQNETGEGEGP
jgi:uncharacterized protein (TIGR02147 family)